MGQTASSCPEDCYDFTVDIDDVPFGPQYREGIGTAGWPCFVSKAVLKEVSRGFDREDFQTSLTARAGDELAIVAADIEPDIETKISKALEVRLDTVCTIGRYKTGKTFVVNGIFGTKLPDGFDRRSATRSLSFKTSFTEAGVKHLILDTAGLESPIPGRCSSHNLHRRAVCSLLAPPISLSFVIYKSVHRSR